MLHSGSGGQGCPLATGPSGLKSEPKAPRNAWREDARHPQGLSTDKADIAADNQSANVETVHQAKPVAATPGTRRDYPPAQQIVQPGKCWDYPPTQQKSQPAQLTVTRRDYPPAPRNELFLFAFVLTFSLGVQSRSPKPESHILLCTQRWPCLLKKDEIKFWRGSMSRSASR